ncbi:MAG: FAD-dependent oxidoreductase [Peptococcaceae bacterium]|jgi:hypothetical protein|nr:FAD-dependent oxidoreductase [Peptococcaceae bacterium]
MISPSGIAGVSAALAAKRSGCDVLLVEKSVMLGGLATLGVVAIYLPLCDGEGKKISSGISEELLRRSIQYGHNTLPPEWLDGKGGAGVTTRYRTDFSVPEFVLALDELMEDEGIEILYDSVCCKLIMAGSVCEGVVIENKTGRRAYMGKIIVDTTGDLELMSKAGVTCAEGDNWLTYWAYATDLESMRNAVEKRDVYAGIKLRWLGATWNGDHTPPGSDLYIGTKSEEITKFILDGRKMLREEIEGEIGRSQAVIALPGMAQLRSGRRLGGYYELTQDDALKHFDDSIGCFSNFKKAGIVYEIPYRALITPEVDNMITAGRSLSASGEAWVFAKVIPACAVSGQAAGLAAAIAVKNGRGLAEVYVTDLQHKIAQAVGIIHF